MTTSQGGRPESLSERLVLLRVSGGATHQSVYTFDGMIRSIADTLRAELLASTLSAGWPGRGFQVSLDGGGLRLDHLEHRNWSATISASDFFFELSPQAGDDIRAMYAVMDELAAHIREQIGVQAINSVGTKFYAVTPESARAKSVHGLVNVLSLTSDEPLLHNGDGTLEEVALRVGYRPSSDISAVLQVTTDVDGHAVLIEVDCYCWETLTLDNSYAPFMVAAYDHFLTGVHAFIDHLLTVPSQGGPS